MNIYILLLIDFFLILQNINAISTISLTPKVAIVTNGVYGIGGKISISLAKQGYDLILLNNENKYYNYDFVERLKKNYNTDIKILNGDITSYKIRNKLFDIYDNKFKDTHDLSILINNHGDNIEYISNNYSIKDKMNFLKYYKNVFYDASIDMCEKFIIRINKINGGSIVNIMHSNVYNKSLFKQELHESCKFLMKGVMNMYKNICIKSNINYNTLFPSIIDYRTLYNIRNFTGDDLFDEYIRKNYIYMGILTTEDISSILLFICSNYGRFITGLTINVNE
tara:strand:+ start:45 stop:887 length:843 start_codon:yes stop_codon:yes gene_type:complete